MDLLCVHVCGVVWGGGGGIAIFYDKAKKY